MSEKIVLKIDSARLTLDDMLALEDAQEGRRPFHSMRDILARFVADVNGYLSIDAAREELGRLSLPQFNEAMTQFIAQVKELQAATIPPASGGV